MMNVVWSLDRNYFRCFKVSVYSFLTNVTKYVYSDISIHFIIIDDIEDDIRKFMKSIGFDGKVSYSFTNFSEIADRIAYDKRLSPASSMRLMIPGFIEGMVLYADCDTMFNGDPSDLMNFYLDGKPIAAKRDLDASWFYSDDSFSQIGFNDRKSRLSYFNAGVMLIDCDKALDGFMEAKKLLQENQYKHAEQDALNIVFKDDCALLPNKFNHFTERDTSFWGFTDEPDVLHFTMDRNKPWIGDHSNCGNRWCSEWLHYDSVIKQLES